MKIGVSLPDNLIAFADEIAKPREDSEEHLGNLPANRIAVMDDGLRLVLDLP